MIETMEVNTVDIAKLHLKDGDTLFVNADAVDLENLRHLQVLSNIAIVPVFCLPGMSVAEQLAVTHTEVASERPNL